MGWITWWSYRFFIVIDSKSLKKINKSNYFSIVITNQPAIAKGFVTKEFVIKGHKILQTFLGNKNVYLNDIFFCPHHPHKGFINEISYLKKDCFCRKPNPGLFLEQAFLRNINLSNSLMIGDSNNDLLAAKNANCNFKNIDSL